MKLGIRTLLLTQILESYLLKRKEEMNKKILHHTPISFALKEYDIHSHHLVLNTQGGQQTGSGQASARSPPSACRRPRLTRTRRAPKSRRSRGAQRW